jgi:hypothetical protein
VVATLTMIVMVVFVVSGVLANMYLYIHGAFRVRRLTNTYPYDDEQLFYDRIGREDDWTQRTLRRIVVFFLGVVFLFVVSVMLLLNLINH